MDDGEPAPGERHRARGGGRGESAARRRGAVVRRGTWYGLEEVRAGCLRASDLPAEGAAGWPAASDAAPAARTDRAARIRVR